MGLFGWRNNINKVLFGAVHLLGCGTVTREQARDCYSLDACMWQLSKTMDNLGVNFRNISDGMGLSIS